MRGSGRIPLTLLAIGFAIFVAANCISASSQEFSTNAGAKFFSAVLLAREAQIEGVQRDTMRELAARLNVALQLLEEADEAKNEGRLGSAQTLLSSAEELLEDVLRAARAEKVAVERASQLRTLTIVLVPVLSAIITVVTGYVLRYVRRRSVERLFKMLIVVKREDEKER